MKGQKWLLRILVGMLVVSFLVTILVFTSPVPARAESCYALMKCDCGCCGADKAVWYRICYRYNYCCAGWCWCIVGEFCGTCW